MNRDKKENVGQTYGSSEYTTTFNFHKENQNIFAVNVRNISLLTKITSQEYQIIFCSKCNKCIIFQKIYITHHTMACLKFEGE